MNILHTVQLYYPVANGAGRYFAEIGERLAREGHRVTVLATDAYDLEHLWAPGKRRIAQAEEMHNGVRIIRFPVRRLPGPPLLYPILRRLMVEVSRVPGTAPLLARMALLTPRMPGMQRYLRALAAGSARPFDVIHGTNVTLDFMTLPVLDFARACGIPFICTPHMHLGVPGDRTILRYYSMRHQIELLKRSDRVIVQTNIEGDYLASRGVARERLRQIGVGVNLDEVAGGDGARFRAEHQIAGPLVLAVGAMAYDKGTVHLVEALRRLWAAGCEATLALIGAPLSHFMRFYEELPEDIRGRIRLLPYAPDEVKRDALAAADLFALPSRTDSFGIVYLEAWCYRLAVVGARAGGVPDVIDDGQNGILVEFGDVAALADAIGRLLHDRALAGRLGQAGYDKVHRELTWEHKYAQVRAVYDELVAQPSAQPRQETVWGGLEGQSPSKD